MTNGAIIVRPDPQIVTLGIDRVPVFNVMVAGNFRELRLEGRPLHVDVKEVDEGLVANKHQGETAIGFVEGKVKKIEPFVAGHYHLVLDKRQNEYDIKRAPKVVQGQPLPPYPQIVGFKFSPNAPPVYFKLPTQPKAHKSNGKLYRLEGDFWQIQLSIPEFDLKSPIFPVLWNRRAISARYRASAAAYDWHGANFLQFYTNASKNKNATSGAFHDMRSVIEDAKSFIFIVDWSFHPTVQLDPTKHDLGSTLGAALLRQAANGILIAINTWYHDSHVAELPNEHAEQIMRQMAGDLGIDYPENNLFWRGSKRTTSSADDGAGGLLQQLYSHHQKFIVADDGDDGRKEVVVLFGGLDLTKGRFDWPDHPILPTDPDAQAFRRPVSSPGNPAVPWQYEEKRTWPLSSRFHQFNDWYNGEFEVYPSPEVLADPNLLHVRQPWHDIHAALKGPIAWDFAREFAGRWMQSSDTQAGAKNAKAISAIGNKFIKELFDRDKFVQQWECRPDGNWSGQLLHSIARAQMSPPRPNPKWHPARQEFTWKVPGSFERSIQDSYLRAIWQAERFIHIENQYFLGSGTRWDTPRATLKNDIPGALVDRIRKKAAKGEAFHVYVVLPMVPEGVVIPGTLNAALGVRNLEFQTIAWMIRSLGRKWRRYISFYFPARSQGVDARVPPGVFRVDKDGKDIVPPIDQRKYLTKQNRRYMVYVHSKLMIVDDRYVILGSANINDRSMAGDRDTEICTALWPSNNRVEADCEQQVQNELRLPLLRDYFGTAIGGAPESTAYRNEFQLRAMQNYQALRAAQPCAGQLAMFPFDVDDDGRLVAAGWAGADLSPTEPHVRIIDSLIGDPDDAVSWTWESNIPWGIARLPDTLIE